jgi:hypothetical protein
MSNREQVLATENSEEFHNRMKAAMEVSFHKYGPVKNAYPHKVSALRSLSRRLKLYEDTGNLDYLVDIANFAMIEYMFPAHPKAHDKPTDGGEGRYWHSGGPANEKDNSGERQIGV